MVALTEMAGERRSQLRQLLESSKVDESVSMDCSDWLVSWKQKRSDHTLQQRETHLFRNNSR